MQRAWRFFAPVHALILWQMESEKNRNWTYCLKSSSGKRIELVIVKKTKCEWCPHYIEDEKKAPVAGTAARASGRGGVKLHQGKLY